MMMLAAQCSWESNMLATARRSCARTQCADLKPVLLNEGVGLLGVVARDGHRCIWLDVRQRLRSCDDEHDVIGLKNVARCQSVAGGQIRLCNQSHAQAKLQPAETCNQSAQHTVKRFTVKKSTEEVPLQMATCRCPRCALHMFCAGVPLSIAIDACDHLQG
jgi:hypothetical protein